MKGIKALVITVISFIAVPIFSGTDTSNIRVYFSPRGGCEQAVIQEISRAKKTVDIAMYYFTSRSLAQVLIEAERQGVEVRVYFDKSQRRGKYSKYTNLLVGGCEIKFKGSSGLMHNKFCVIDGKTLVTGSYNWTDAAETKNDENLFIIEDEKLCKIFEEKFKELWNK